MRKGIAVSPGVAVGTAYCINQVYVSPTAQRKLAHTEISAELARYETARDMTAADLRSFERKVASQVGPEEAAIFAVHESILWDAAFTKKIRSWIVDERLTAQAALARLMEEYAERFSGASEEFLKERLNDVRDVVMRLSSHLSDVLKQDGEPLEGNVIVIAEELLPSQAVALGNVDVHGIVTQTGSQTSHAAIIARSRGIPAVSGVAGILKQVKTGDPIVVDGRTGHVIVEPESEVLTAYRKLEREFVNLKNELAANRDQAAHLKDGTPLHLLANINSVHDAQTAAAMGASGVGLFRTEYLYLTHPDVPDEEEQYCAYCDIFDAAPGKTVTVRTLDIGGDKTIPYLGHRHQEANPFLGWRSIRLSFEHPEFFMTQIRAILRAQEHAVRHGGTLRLMFPMITTLEELLRVRKIVRKCCERLEADGKPFAEPPLGIMIEVPAAAITIHTMLKYCDFVSVGSNDLVQYLMAADRDNPKVNHLCESLAPAVLRTLHRVIRCCNKANKPITVCGEMAGKLSSFVLLSGMGLRSFSMSPAFVPTIKDLASHLSVERAEAIFRQASRMTTTGRVKKFLHQELEKIAPELGALQTD
jgi:phosphotransferase system enzyme I (PtsI)